ncbi:MAG TPA: hypothetical protein VIG25_06325 [Pyrinomonadaceae bacterium]
MSHLEQTSKRAIAAFAVFLVILIGVVDFATGLELHLMFFYLLPIALVSWFVNRRTGIFDCCAVRVDVALGESCRGPSIFLGFNYALEFFDARGGFHSDRLLDLAT